MESMRSTWTDSRLDHFAKNTEGHLDALERRMDEGFREIRGEIGSLQHTIIGVGGGVIAAIMGVIASVIATQL